MLYYLLVGLCLCTPSLAQTPGQETYLRDLESRVSYAEEKIRALTSQLEELSHTIKVMQQNAALATPVGTVVGAPNDNNMPQKPSTEKTTSTPTKKDKEQQQVEAAAIPPVPNKNNLPTTDVQASYDQAISFLNRGEYKKAEDEFKTLIKNYPKHNLAVNAKYWLGETYMAQSNYTDAAVAFAEAYQIYKAQSKKPVPQGANQQELSKAPEALLKLAFALKGMGKTEEACATLAQVNKEFPQLPHNLLKLSSQARQGLKCR